MAKIKFQQGETIWVIRHDRTARGRGTKWYYLFLRRDKLVIDVTQRVAGQLGLETGKRWRSRRGRSAIRVEGMVEDAVNKLSKKLFKGKGRLLVKYAVLGQPPWNTLNISQAAGKGGDSREIPTEVQEQSN